MKKKKKSNKHLLEKWKEGSKRRRKVWLEKKFEMDGRFETWTPFLIDVWKKEERESWEMKSGELRESSKLRREKKEEVRNEDGCVLDCWVCV